MLCCFRFSLSLCFIAACDSFPTSLIKLKYLRPNFRYHLSIYDFFSPLLYSFITNIPAAHNEHTLTCCVIVFKWADFRLTTFKKILDELTLGQHEHPINCDNLWSTPISFAPWWIVYLKMSFCCECFSSRHVSTKGLVYSGKKDC